MLPAAYQKSRKRRFSQDEIVKFWGFTRGKPGFVSKKCKGQGLSSFELFWKLLHHCRRRGGSLGEGGALVLCSVVFSYFFYTLSIV
jgi:hypothetical protein